MTDAERRAILRARADALVKQAEELREEADKLFPLTEDEKTTREVEEDDDAFYALFARVFRTVQRNPGISADDLAKAMDLPNDYPSEGANYFTLQLLHKLESMGWVTSDRTTKPYAWSACESEHKRPTLTRVK